MSLLSLVPVSVGLRVSFWGNKHGEEKTNKIAPPRIDVHFVDIPSCRPLAGVIDEDIGVPEGIPYCSFEVLNLCF